MLKPGDVVYVETVDEDGGVYELQQPPEIQGALVAMDPHTGRVLAMVGGFSLRRKRVQPGDAGAGGSRALRSSRSSTRRRSTTAIRRRRVVIDAPIEIDVGQAIWRPENYGGKFYGPATLRTGIEKSRNVMTVRLAQDMGMPLVAEYARRFGIYDNMGQYLPMALGAGETTVLRITAAYATLANGGRKITPTLIDRIQDRYGDTIYKHDQRQCVGCASTDWYGQAEPELVDDREQMLDPYTAYQVTSMMEGVVQRGTATSVREVGKPIGRQDRHHERL